MSAHEVQPEQAVARAVKVRPLRPREREGALALLARDARLNLLLIDAIRQLGRNPGPGEARPEVLGAWRGAELVGVASLQPTIAVDARVEPAALRAFLPHVASVHTGLVKISEELTAPLWQQLESEGRRALLDRFESGYVVSEDELRTQECPAGAKVRAATREDLPRLVEAARASLREESRPDPFVGDPTGFRRWVAGRVNRAAVVDCGGEIGFVGYADVRCDDGWLLQGVYTWPHWRRRGLAAAGMSTLCRQAFAAGARHVQLAVVEGNAAAERLYAGLGFRRFARLRTILFE